ncbi:MAG: hypothetical protein EAZ89_11545 [Bacteroidetes bacterium]|nr:MAG: hypothetical protein EAZ89_11545 [Bacteroidota bacterium]
MKHLRLLSFALLLIPMLTFAQEVSEAPRTFIKKETKNALSIVVQGLPKNVEAVLDQKIRTNTGMKGKPESGLTLYPQVRYADISTNSLDLYTRVEKASKTSDTESRVTLFLSSGNGNFLDSKTNSEEIRRATTMLQSLEMEVKIYEVNLVIEEQKKVVEKALLVQEKLVKDSVELERKLAETMQAIEQNKRDRANQVMKISEEQVRKGDFEHKLASLQEQQTAGIAARKQKELDELARKAQPVAPATSGPDDTAPEEPKKEDKPRF